MLRLYRAPWSTNCERVAIALAYKGLETESVWIDYGHRAPVEAVSGQPLVPVVELDGEVVFDSTRILRRLEQLAPEPPLFPREPARRAEMDVFLEWFNDVWKRPPNEIEAELGRPETDVDKIERLAARMDGWLDVFESMLGGRDYLMGDALSAADCAAYPFLKFAAGRDPADGELFHRVLDERQSVDGRPRLAAWIERVRRLPQV
ncbi:MAG: glutathione S-transferase family protein [Thermoleophilaceae bacterium]